MYSARGALRIRARGVAVDRADLGRAETECSAQLPVFDRGALAVSVFGDREDVAVADLQHRYDALAAPKPDADHAPGHAAHGPDVALLEADALAGAGEQHDVAVAVGQAHVDQLVFLGQVDRPDTGGPSPRGIRERGWLSSRVLPSGIAPLASRTSWVGSSRRSFAVTNAFLYKFAV